MTKTLNTIVLLAALALAGCDDVLLFDVAPNGRLLAAIDGRGKVVAVGDAKTVRHLAIVDPTADTVDRLTDTAVALSWPRFCGPSGDVIFVEGRKTLVHLAKDGTRRVLFESDRRLEQPTPSPTGDRVAVLEVRKLGVPGLLHTVDVATGAAGVPLDGALLGFAWTPRGDLLVPRLGAGDVDGAAPFEGGEGEVLHLRGDDRRVLYTGPLAGAVWITATPSGAVCVLPRGPGKVGLALLAPDGSGATRGEETEALDLWPTAGSEGRVLFTRSRPGRPTLEGELRLARADALGSSTQIPTPGPMCAPRWVGTDRVAYLTPDDRLVTQGIDGRGVVDWTERLRPLAGDLP